MTDAPRDGRGGHPARPVRPRVFRAASGTVALIVGGIVTLLLLIDAVVRAGWAQTFLIAPWLLIVLWVIYVSTYLSHVAIDGEGATVQNGLRRIRIPWRRVTDVAFRYQVRFVLDEGKPVGAFGGPVAGRPTRPGLRGAPDPRHRQPPALRDLALIREQWEHATETGSGEGVVTRSWDVPAVIALGVLVLWVLGAVIISNGFS